MYIKNVKIIFKKGLIFKDKASKHLNFKNDESAPPEKLDLIIEGAFSKIFCTIKFNCMKVT